MTTKTIAEPVIEELTPAEIKKRLNPGKEQWSRFGGQGDWDIEPLVGEILTWGYHPEEVIEVCGKEILDGNRRASAFVEAAKREPDRFKNVKARVRFHPETLTREEKEQLRLRKARGTKAWSRADYIHSMVNIVLDYPGDAPEEYMAEKVGIHRILEQFPRAIKLDDKGQPERDAKGKLVFQNRQGPFQDAKRLARLPVFVREAFLRGLNNQGPAIPSRNLTTLVADWDKDKAANPQVAKAASLKELVEIFPDSQLSARLQPLLGQVTQRGRGAGLGVMSAKDMDSTLSAYAASRPAVALVSYIARKKGYASEEVNRMLKQLFVRLETLATNDPEASKILAAIQTEVAKG